jgi:hypothetical protein
MKTAPKLKQLFHLCLILTFVLVGCSSDDQSTNDDSLAEKTAVENGNSTAKRVTAEGESLYSKAIKDKIVVRGDFKSDYTAALKALEKEDYDKARDLLTKAIAVNNIEQLKLRFTGMHFGTYFPHYHLGMIAFLKYDCVAAMDHWDTSLRQGTIQKSSEYQYLQDGLLECKPEGA